MISAVLMMTVLALLLGLALSLTSHFFHVDEDPLVEKIDAILPQTQCGQCTFTGCKPYAEAMSKGEADINQCPPGGNDIIEQLAELLGVESKPLNAEHGEHNNEKMLAIIDENVCIGCTLCIQACPVDAILGAAKQMHTVIADECTGCELCIPPCPVECIIMQPIEKNIKNWKWDAPENSQTISNAL
ncbi:MAG: electron transport complex subunit RsxB [Methylococcales bacterium]|jgi:Na+-translocating ferredoxin:NAD+ oxidoreductase subunit B|nr:electron transport complex subunit RsxB [Methylococcales bacterium]